MADLAVLGLQFETKGGEAAVRTLDNVARGSREAERASDGMATSQRRARLASDDLAGGLGRAETATAQMARSIMQAERQAIELYRQQQALAGSTRQLGAAAESAAVDFASMYDAHDRNFAAQYAAGMDRVATSTKLAGFEMLYFGRQLGDVATMAAMGASPLMILTTQGAQVAEGFAMVGQRGVTLTAVFRQLAAQALALAAAVAPFAIAAAAIAGPLLLWRKHLDDVRQAMEATGRTQAEYTDLLGTASDALSQALEFTERYALESDGLSRALDGVLSAQSASYRETLAGIDPTDRAAKSAAQRAEMERLLAVNILRRAAADAQARANDAADAEREARNTARFEGVMAGVGRAWMGAEMPGSIDPLATSDRARAEAERRLGVADKARIAAEERNLALALSEQADAMAAVSLAGVSAASALQSYSGSSAGAARASKGATEAIDEQARAYAQLVEDLKTPAEKELELLHWRMVTLRTEFDLNRISAETYREQFDRLWTGKPELLSAVNAELQQMPEHLRDGVDPLEDLRRHFEDVEAATRGIRWSIDDVARAIEEKDWASVFAGLLRTLERVKELWNSGQPGAKSSAVGSVLGAVGGAVGGTAGGVISGVGSGFSAFGAASAMKDLPGLAGAIGGLAGPIGIAVAGFSILNSVLSSQAAKKRAKAEAEARDIENARTIAQERANKRAELELELLRVSGDELAYLTKVRENELAALDSVSAAIQRQIYALEDWQKTVTAAEGAVAQAQAQVSQAEADLRRAYETERDRLLGIMGGVEDARQALEQAYDRERSAIEATVNGVEGLIESLRDFRQELDLNPLAQGSLAQGRGAALAQFQAAGPEDAPTAGRAFLDASLASARTMLDFQRDRALVARAVDEMSASAEAQLSDAERQLMALDKQVEGLMAANDNLLSVEAAIRNLLTAEQAAAEAQMQLAALDAQVGALINLNTSFMSVAQAIGALASAQQSLADAQAALLAAQAAKPAEGAGGPAYEAVGFEGYVQKNADLAQLFASGTGMARGRSMAEFGAYHWERYGQAEDRFYRPFANGGAFGAGGVVMNPTAFDMGQMGEAGPEAIMPLTNVGGKLGVRAANDGTADEVRALAAKLDRLIAVSERTERHTDEANTVLQGAARGISPLSTEPFAA